MTIDEKDWRKLCAQAAVESDPGRLLEIIERLIRALDECRDEMRKKERRHDVTSSSDALDE
ncbi:MAG: hypothetical protein ABSG02_07235 [Terriglobales bacterium]|jgi:hypothetical protein